MNTKTKTKTEREAHAKTPLVITAGKIFDDGKVIELIRSPGGKGPYLLVWDGKRATTGHSIECWGSVYGAPDLAPSLARAMRLPPGIKDYSSARSLFAEITDLFQKHLDLPGQESGLLATFTIGTWMADSLPTAPSLAISGSTEEGIDALRLLNCVCRHALTLAEITPSGLRSLPMEVGLTLLVNQQELRPNLQRLFRASSFRGLNLFGNRGRLVDLYGAKAVLYENDAAVDTFSGGVIQISLLSSRLRSSALGEQALNEIADRFQPRLLMYRLRNVGKAPATEVDVSTFTSGSQQLARSIAMCFPEDSVLARDAVQLLLPQDEEIRGRCFCDVNYVIIEILLAIAREGKQRAVQVDELAKDVSTLLTNRGEAFRYSPEQIGWRLRNLNIRRHSSSSGREILLNKDTKENLQRSARAYGLACGQTDPTNVLDDNPTKVIAPK